MRILVDSNIVLRLLHHASPQHQIAFDATEKIRLATHRLCLAPQNIYEVWSVATRPTTVNGLGFSNSQIQTEVSNMKSHYDLLEETPSVFSEWEKLVALHAILGKNVHDTRLVAAMMVHGITHLLTFNKQDFQRYSNITVLTPADVIATP